MLGMEGGSAARVAQRQRGWRSRRYSWCWSQGALACPARAVATPRVTWSAPKLVDGLPPFGDPAVGQSIACPGPTLCLSVGSEGSVKTSRDPSNVGSGRKATLGVDRGSTLRHVSCPSVSLCVAVDNSGNVLPLDNPTGGPATWTTAAVHPGGQPVDVSVCEQPFAERRRSEETPEGFWQAERTAMRRRISRRGHRRVECLLSGS